MARRPLSTVARAASAKGRASRRAVTISSHGVRIQTIQSFPSHRRVRISSSVATTSVWRRAGRLVPVDGGRHPRYGWNSSAVPLDRLRKWEHLHPLCMDDRHAAEDMWTGSMWECPDFSALDDRHVLITSIWDKRHFVVSSGVRRHLPRPHVAAARAGALVQLSSRTLCSERP